MRSWLAQHESEYDRIDYNVRIGAARDPGPAFPEYVRRTARLSSQLRLDAVAWQGAQPTILELKFWATSTAVQQLAIYGAVWREDTPAGPAPRLLLVAIGAEQGVAETAAAANISLVLLGEP